MKFKIQGTLESKQILHLVKSFNGKEIKIKKDKGIDKIIKNMTEFLC